MNRRGFTIIELLMVFMVLGLLAAIMLPRLQGYRKRAWAATMRSDLRTLGLHEESSYYDHTTYTDDLAVLQAGGFFLSPNVNVVVNEATFLGWSATATHDRIPVQCYIFVGNAAPVGTSVVEGSVECSWAYNGVSSSNGVMAWYTQWTADYGCTGSCCGTKTWPI